VSGERCRLWLLLRPHGSSSGFDTTKLFIGAEGTLGIITEVTIRLAPRLPTNVAIAQFPDVRAATEAVRDVRPYKPSLPAVQYS